MTTLLVHPAEAPLQGRIAVPADKSLGHRALVLAALGEGASVLSRMVCGADLLSTVQVLRQLGVSLVEKTRGSWHVEGRGLRGLQTPSSVLDCGNSGTTLRLLAGVLAAQKFPSQLTGDVSLVRRPMQRIVAPLRMRGAHLVGHGDGKECSPPLRISPVSTPLQALDYKSPLASAQVKSALLLSGLYAEGPTRVQEPYRSRNHTELMLLSLGVPLSIHGTCVELDPLRWNWKLPSFSMVLPGDLSSAAYLLAASFLVQGSRVTVQHVGVNPTRTGFFDVAQAMGASLSVDLQGEEMGEGVANLHGQSGPLKGCTFEGELTVRSIDEIPILCALAARAKGVTTMRSLAELRVKESDRLASMSRVLRAFGVAVEETQDGLCIEGTDSPLCGADVHSGGDHRIAMAAAVLALVAEKPSRIVDTDCIGTSFPTFLATCRDIGARMDLL